MADLGKTQSEVMDFMIAYVVHSFQPDIQDHISILNTQKQWAERLLKSKPIQAIILNSACQIHTILTRKVAAKRQKLPRISDVETGEREEAEEGPKWCVTNRESVEEVRAWHQRVRREEEERNEQFKAQLRRLDGLAEGYEEEVKDGNDYKLYQCASERHMEDTSRSTRLIHLLESASSSVPFFQDLRDISVLPT